MDEAESFDGILIDLIFEPSGHVVDDEMFDRSEELDVHAVRMRVAAALKSHCSGGRSVSMPASARARSAASACSGRTCAQSICSLSARAVSRAGAKSRFCSRSERSFVASTSSRGWT
jgi:hypothetical protein